MTRIHRYSNDFMNKAVGVVTFWPSSFLFSLLSVPAHFPVCQTLKNQIKYIPKNHWHTFMEIWNYRYIHTAFLRCFSHKRKSWGDSHYPLLYMVFHLPPQSPFFFPFQKISTFSIFSHQFLLSGFWLIFIWSLWIPICFFSEVGFSFLWLFPTYFTSF